MKFSKQHSLCGTIYHPITKLIHDLKNGTTHDAVAICSTDEIFDEAMVTITNRYPQAIGIVAEPNPGTIMPARATEVSIYVDTLGVTVKVHIMTKALYNANKVAVDALGLKIHEMKFSGGQI